MSEFTPIWTTTRNPPEWTIRRPDGLLCNGGWESEKSAQISCNEWNNKGFTIELIHAENKMLIAVNNITLGSEWELKDILTPRMPQNVTLTSIHGLYGWLIFNNKDNNAPQRVSEFIKIYKRKLCNNQ